jgi:hypothetical protein
MTTNRDLERLLDAWLAEGPNEVADRVIDDVADRIERQPQQPAWRLRWRTPMSPTYKLGAAAAAVIIVAVLGYNLLPRQPSTGGGPISSPSPTAGPTSSPVATGAVALTDGTLTGGRYRLQPLDDPSTLRIVADIPAGWQGLGSGYLVSPGQAEEILIVFMVTDGLFSDPCHWDLNGTGLGQPGDVVVGPTVDDLVAALKANTSYTSSSATPLTFGQFEGQELELQLPGDAVLSTCDKHGEGSPFSGPAYFVFPGGIYAQGPNSRWHLYIVDVDGTRLITIVSILEGTPQADIAAAEAIVASFEITP